VTREALNIPENKIYPPAYAKRRVAGWAILRFDVAPWGQVGAIEVLASQPTQAFADAARGLLMGARPSPPPSGYRGCVVPMIYAIPTIPDEGY
jgi:TonB family protein